MATVNPELAREISDLRAGDHLCLIFEHDPQEQMPALVPLIKQALDRNEQFVYVSDDQSVAELTMRLEEYGIPVSEESARGCLRIWTRREWREPGELSSESKGRQVQEIVRAARAAGFEGIRFAIEMTWTLAPAIAAQKLEHWEATINTLFTPEFPVRMICQYNRSRLFPEALVCALRTHPLVILAQDMMVNPFYEAPLILGHQHGAHADGRVNGESSRERLDWMISQLERIRAAQKLHEELIGSRRAGDVRRHLAAIVEYSDDAIISKNLDGVIKSWNKAAERIFGFRADEVVGKPVTLLIPEERLDEESRILAQIRAGRPIDHFETIRRRKDGSLVNVSLTVSPVRDEAGRIIGVSKIARDITERKEAEREQQKHERRQEALYDLVARVNRAGDLPEIYEAALDAICRCQNADRASILLKDESGVLRFKAWRGLSEGYRLAVEGRSLWAADDPDPQPVWVEDVGKSTLPVSLRAVVQAEGIQCMAFIPITYQLRLVGKFMLYYNAPHRFSLQEIRPAQTIASQITFAIERQKSGHALERLVQERTASLREAIAQMEEFSYSVSHDLRAPVRAMQGYARAVLEDYGSHLDVQGRDYVDRIVRGSERMDRLIQDILTFSRLSRREIHLHPVSLDRLLREIVEQYSEIDFRRDKIFIEGELLTVVGHEPSLSQAISNLLNNAVKFVPPGTYPRVRVWSERRGDQVRLWIEDNGIGIKPEYQHRLFGMFERIHPEKHYEGTGIGLAIVRKAVERMGGRVGVESDGLTGSRFWMQLGGVPDLCP